MTLDPFGTLLPSSGVGIGKLQISISAGCQLTCDDGPQISISLIQ